MNVTTKPAELAGATLARRIADFAAGLTYDAIPGTVRERARIQILDGIGVGLASNAYPFAERALAGIVALGGAGDCGVLGRTERLPYRDAALANGILIHGLDFDDTHLASIVHATAASLPCALSLGEHLGVDGRDTAGRLRSGDGGRDPHRRGREGRFPPCRLPRHRRRRRTSAAPSSPASCWD